MQGIQLRDYQERAESSLRTGYAVGFSRQMLVMPTGAGKTATFSHIALQCAAKGGRVLILVHRQELLRQCSNALDRLGVVHGLIAQGCSFQPHAVQVASVQTLVRRMERLPWKPTFIIIDECHHAVAGSWRKVIDYYNAKILGVTATPVRLDGRGLNDVFDNMVLGPTIADLTAMGFLCPTRVFAPPMKASLKGVRIKGGDYDQGQLAEAMDSRSVVGDAVEHYSRICPGAPAIAFCASVAHAVHTAEQFREAGYRAQSLDGSMPSAERAALIADLGAGRLDVLTSCEIVSEGTDIPVVTAAILLRPTKSEGLYLQQVGRVLRPAPGKTHAIILDHAGMTLEHGLPGDDREWSLEGKKKREGKAAPSVRMCPQCFAAHPPAPVCPCCGFQYVREAREIEEASGELAELTHSMEPGSRIQVFVTTNWVSGFEFRGDAGDGRAWVAYPKDSPSARIVNTEWLEPLEKLRLDPEFQQQERRREQAKAGSLEQLIALGRQRGYKNPVAWAQHVHNARRSRAAVGWA